MSGPKIVDLRLVRAVEDRQWISLRSRLRNAMEEWRRCAAEHPGAVTAGAMQSLDNTLASLDAVHSSIAPPRSIRDLLDRARGQLQFVREEATLLRQQATVQLASQQQKQRRLDAAIEDAAARLSNAGFEEERAHLLEARTETALEAALCRLAAREREGLSEALQQAADDLAGQSQIRSLREWQRDENPALDRLDHLAAEWSVLTGAPPPAAIQSKLDSLRSIRDERTLRLQTDSLVLQMDEALAQARRERERQQLLDDLAADLSAFDTVPDALTVKLTALRTEHGFSVESFAEEVEAWTSAEARRRDASRIRELLLGSLRDMGYEIREGMATAWTEEGSIVVRQPGSADYAVELREVSDRIRTELIRVGQPDAESTPAQRQRDVEIETQWCATHAAVLEELRTQGLSAEILVSRPPGAQTVAVRPASESEGRDRRAPGVAQPREREME